MRCQAMTRKGNGPQCPNQTAMAKDGVFLCHLHHPDQLRSQQIAANRAEKAQRKSQRAEIQSLHDRQYDRDADAIRDAKGLSKPNRRG